MSQGEVVPKGGVPSSSEEGLMRAVTCEGGSGRRGGMRSCDQDAK